MSIISNPWFAGQRQICPASNLKFPPTSHIVVSTPVQNLTTFPRGWTEEQTGAYTKSMKNKQQIWTAMILAYYAKRLGITVSQAAEKLLLDGGLAYLEDCYEALHTQSNDDVIDELIDMAAKGSSG